MKKIKEFFKKHKNLLLLILTLIMFIISMFSSFLYGYLKAYDEISSSCQANTKNANKRRLSVSTSSVNIFSFDFFDYDLYYEDFGNSISFVIDEFINDNEHSYIGIDFNANNNFDDLVNFVFTISDDEEFKSNYSNLNYPLTLVMDGFLDSNNINVNVARDDDLTYYTTDYFALLDVNDSEVPFYFYDDYILTFNNYDEFYNFFNYFELSFYVTYESFDYQSNSFSSYLMVYFNLFDYSSNYFDESLLNQYYQDGYQNGYNQGFTDGVESAINPLIGFDNTVINYGYFTDTNELYLVDGPVDVPINGDTYGFITYVDEIIQSRIDNGGYNENGRSMIAITNFTPFLDNTLELSPWGFNQIQYIYTDNSYGFVNISNENAFTSHIINNNKLVKEILLFFNANNYWDNYALQLFTTNNYQDGYQNGYNQGLIIGEENGYQNGYNQGLIIGEENGYNNGYDLGYNFGYNTGRSDGCSLSVLFLGLADVPIYILSKLLGFELFGFNLFGALTSLVTVLLIFYLYKKFK